MNSSSFRSAPLPEVTFRESTRKTRINWDKIVYLTVVALIVLALARFVGYEALFVRTDGQIVAGMFDVRLSSDVRITRFLVAEGDTVEAGAELFEYVTMDEVESAAPPNAETVRKRLTEELEVRDKLELKMLEKQKSLDLRDYYASEFERVKEGVYLGIYTTIELKTYEKQLMEATSSLSLIDKEISILNERLEFVRGLTNGNASLVSLDDMNRTYSSPASGRIENVYKLGQEIVMDGENILSLALEDRDKLFVRSIFEKDDMKHVRERDEVTIKHSTGETSRGVVHRLYAPSARRGQSETDLTLVNRFVLADIHPLLPSDRDLWKRHKDVSVGVMKYKF